MKRIRFVFIPAVVLAAMLCACAGQEVGRGVGEYQPPANKEVSIPPAGTARTETVDPARAERLAVLLEEIAELERSGLFRKGMGAAESAIREKAGDYPGAVAAAYKEMLWAYGHGFMAKAELEKGLVRAAALDEQGTAEGESAASAARALLAFEQKKWEEAEQSLAAVFAGDDTPDSFPQWLLLSCLLEKNPSDKKAAGAYRAIRSRYAQLPDYWYRGARLFEGTIACEFAELCINLAPSGPAAAECRLILAHGAGLKPEDGASLKSKSEIEDLVSRSVQEGNPSLLSELMPLVSLPENPYTVYAVGALKALAVAPAFRDYFTSVSAVSKGRLADRLAYICRG